MLKKTSSILIFSLTILSCSVFSDSYKSKIDGVYIPKNLTDAISEIDKFYKDSLKTEIKKMSEDDFTADYHFGTGLSIRNNWNLWKGSRLSRYFNRQGINHPDDMSGIILTSYYRHLTSRDIDLLGQVKHYKDYWKKAKLYAAPKVEDFPESDLKFNGGIAYGDYTENRKHAILHFIENSKKNSYWIYDHYIGWKKINKKIRDDMESWKPENTEELLNQLFK